MRIAIGCDHAGVALKSAIIAFLREKGHEVTDFGTSDPNVSCDYPLFAQAVAEAVARKEFSLGILLCGTGIGMSIAANKVRGIRAACVHDCYTARLAKEHNNANIITIGARLIAPEFAKEIVDAFMKARFQRKHKRHLVRLRQISEMEKGLCYGARRVKR
jgi:ribose 5-phosphate isomerase B